MTLYEISRELVSRAVDDGAFEYQVLDALNRLRDLLLSIRGSLPMISADPEVARAVGEKIDAALEKP